MRPGRDAAPLPLLVPRSRKSRATLLLPLWAVGGLHEGELYITFTIILALSTGAFKTYNAIHETTLLSIYNKIQTVLKTIRHRKVKHNLPTVKAE